MSHAQVHSKAKAARKFVPQPINHETEVEDMLADEADDGRWATPILEQDEDSGMMEEAESYCAELCGFHSGVEMKDWLEEEIVTTASWMD